MINPVPKAIAPMTVMLWILWSDTLRARRPAPILYAVRIALFVIVSGILAVNLVRYPEIFNTTSRLMTVAAVVVGLVGAGYFVRRLVRRR